MKQTRFNYGWVILGVGFAMLALSGGIWYSFSVFFVAVLNEFGWSRSFQLLTFSIFSGTFATQAILTHQVAFFTDQGLENLFAFYVVGMVGLVSIGAKIFWGILSDKIGREKTYTLGIICGV